ncbi:MAG: hypothetical protein JSU79_09610 [Dehalococcoidales bacterium]|nr:MAG: hypothetical protein JSU79_09610 [Dehalococcoidales bacterium]
MKGKKKLIRLFTLIISIILLVSLLGTAGTVFADEGDDTGDEKSIPPGQMVRNGLSGPVVGVNVTSGYFLVETKFGIVQVCTNQTVNASMIGQRIAVKLEKVDGGASMYAHNGTDNGTESEFGYIYRVARALQFRLIPSKSAMNHKWGTVESSSQGCVFVDEEGTQIPAVCGNSSGNVIGLIGGSGNGTSGNVTPLLLQTQHMGRILARIQLRLEQAEDEGDEKTYARLQRQLEKLNEKQLRLEAKRAEKAADKGKKGPKSGKK